MTNLLISGQFIQFRNLDFKDKDCSFTTQGMATARLRRVHRRPGCDERH